MVLLQRKLCFSKDQEGSNLFFFFFFGGGGCGGVEVQMLIYFETHITCDFPGGSGPPIPPLWIRTWYWYMYIPGHWYCISRERGYLVLYLINPGSGYLISTGTSLLSSRFNPGSRLMFGKCVVFFFFFF